MTTSYNYVELKQNRTLDRLVNAYIRLSKERSKALEEARYFWQAYGYNSSRFSEVDQAFTDASNALTSYLTKTTGARSLASIDWLADNLDDYSMKDCRRALVAIHNRALAENVFSIYYSIDRRYQIMTTIDGSSPKKDQRFIVDEIAREALAR